MHGVPYSRGPAIRLRRYRQIPVLFSLLALTACPYFEDNALNRVKSEGRLVVLTRVSPSTYYETPEGLAGFEYDLAKAFADSLGVELKVLTAERASDILPRLLAGEADLAAAGLAVTEDARGFSALRPPTRPSASRSSTVSAPRARRMWRSSSGAISRSQRARSTPSG